MMVFFSSNDEDFPILSMLKTIHDAAGEPGVSEALSRLTQEARQQLNVEVSLIFSGVPDDPFIDYIRMRKYGSN